MWGAGFRCQVSGFGCQGTEVLNPCMIFINSMLFSGHLV
ncbi:hypothetical protein D1AOALGA4SA_766 [Olavius algarvensis Delta 1 endosymbiont]|nr:hypothetical protein D1AOALGA4SA_766 [Olavius algarvensis Delta 1 endosymbiont]